MPSQQKSAARALGGERRGCFRKFGIFTGISFKAGGEIGRNRKLLLHSGGCEAAAYADGSRGGECGFLDACIAGGDVEADGFCVGGGDGDAERGYGARWRVRGAVGVSGGRL